MSDRRFVFKYRESTEKTGAYKFNNDNLLYKHKILFVAFIVFDYKIIHHHHRKQKSERKG